MSAMAPVAPHYESGRPVMFDPCAVQSVCSPVDNRSATLLHPAATHGLPSMYPSPHAGETGFMRYAAESHMFYPQAMVINRWRLFVNCKVKNVKCMMSKFLILIRRRMGTLSILLGVNIVTNQNSFVLFIVT